MLKRIYIAILWFLLCSTVSARDADSVKREQREVYTAGVTTAPLFPYWGGSTKLPKGITHDIIMLMERDLDVEIEYVAFDTIGDLKEAVRTGAVDFAIGYLKTDQNQDDFLFSNPIYKDEIVGWVNDGFKDKDVGELRWACMEGSSHCTVLKGVGATSIKEIATNTEFHDALSNGDVDGLIGFYASFIHQYKVNSKDNQEMYFDERFGSVYSRIIINKNKPELKRRMDRFIFENKNEHKSDYLESFYFKYSGARDVHYEWYENNNNELVIKYTIEEDVFPYSYIDDKSGEYTGFIHDYFDRLEAITPLEFEYVPPAGQSVMEMLSKGVIDVIPMASNGSYNDKIFISTKDIIDVRYTLIEREPRNENGQYAVLDRFSNLKGDSRVKGFALYDDVEDLLTDFESGQINFVYINKYLINLIIENYKDLDFNIISGGDFLNLDSKSPMLLRRGDRELKELLESSFALISYGEIDSIWNDYDKVNYHIGYDRDEIKVIFIALIVVCAFVLFFSYIYSLRTRNKLKGEADKNRLSESQRKFLHDIIDNLPNYICIRNKEGDVLLSNNEFKQFYEDCQCKDLECLSVFFNNENYDLRAELSEIIEITDQEHPLYGSHFSLVNKSIIDHVNRNRFFMTILTDVTKIKQRERFLLQARQEAESAVQQKQNFLAIISHELRTPISGILGLMELLDERLKDKLNKEMLHNASISTSKLKLLVDDILDFSKIEANQLHIHSEVTNVAKELSPIIHSFEVLAKRKGLVFSLDWKPGRFFEAEVDILRVSQVISNILSNAIKFTDNGSVRCYVALESDRFVFRVEDKGIGMDEGELSNIFSPFVQAQNNIARKFGGTGLGMSIVKNLVEMMGGQVSVASEKYIGTTVSVEIPTRSIEFLASKTSPVYKIGEHDMARWLDINQIKYQMIERSNDSVNANFYPSLVVELLRGEFSSRAASQSISEMNELSGRVLVVDDDSVNRFLIKLQLDTLGLESEVVEDPFIALELITENHSYYGAIITDLHMPNINGFELVKEVGEVAPKLPVLLCTADNSTATNEQAKLMGINFVLYKPYELIDLYGVLSGFFPQQGNKVLSDRIDENPTSDAYDDWLSHLKKENRIEMTRALINSLEQALWEIESKDVSMRSVVHRLKGTAASLSLPLIGEVCGQLELDIDNQTLSEILVENIQTVLGDAKGYLKSQISTT